MRYLILLAFTLIAIILESWPDAPFTAYGARPELTLAIAVFLALEHDWRDALAPLFLVGLTRDVFSGFTPGFYAGGYLLVGWLMSGLRQAMFRRNPLSQVIIALVAGALINAGAWVVYRFGHAGVPPETINLAAVSACYTALLTPFVYGLLRRMGKTLSFESLWRIGVAPGQPR